MSSFLKGEMGAKETAGRVSCGSKASAFRPVREVRLGHRHASAHIIDARGEG